MFCRCKRHVLTVILHRRRVGVVWYGMVAAFNVQLDEKEMQREEVLKKKPQDEFRSRSQMISLIMFQTRGKLKVLVFKVRLAYDHTFL